MAAPVYDFRPVTMTDMPLLTRWFAEPHVAQWWDDAEHGTDEIAAAMQEPWTEPFIVLCDRRPIGYQQCYDPHAEADHPYRDQPLGTRGIDQFIGEPDMLGSGHGSAFVRTFVARLFDAGAPRVVTDPDPRNARAIRAYEKAGFRPAGRRTTLFGEALFMTFDRLPGIKAA
jgi:aminoglycoside 6'-N-acetyltransferase